MSERLTARETAQRHERIIALRLEEWTWERIAAEVGLTERACRKVWQAWQAQDSRELLETSETERVQTKLGALRALRVKLADVAYQAATQTCEQCGERCGHVAQPAVVHGAVRTLADLHTREIELLQKFGMLPNDLGTIRVEHDMRFLFQVYEEALRRFVPERYDEITGWIEERLALARRGRAPAAALAP